jgi:hypothetical protein
MLFIVLNSNNAKITLIVYKFSLLASYIFKKADITKLWRYYRHIYVNNAKVSLYSQNSIISNELRKMMHLITPKLPC